MKKPYCKLEGSHLVGWFILGEFHQGAILLLHGIRASRLEMAIFSSKACESGPHCEERSDEAISSRGHARFEGNCTRVAGLTCVSLWRPSRYSRSK